MKQNGSLEGIKAMNEQAAKYLADAQIRFAQMSPTMSPDQRESIGELLSNGGDSDAWTANELMDDIERGTFVA